MSPGERDAVIHLDSRWDECERESETRLRIRPDGFIDTIILDRRVDTWAAVLVSALAWRACDGERYFALNQLTDDAYCAQKLLGLAELAGIPGSAEERLAVVLRCVRRSALDLEACGYITLAGGAG